MVSKPESYEYVADYNLRLVKAYEEILPSIPHGFKKLAQLVLGISEDQLRYYKHRDAAKLKRTSDNQILDFMITNLQDQYKNGLGSRQIASFISQKGIYHSRKAIVKGMKRTNRPFVRLSKCTRFTTCAGENNNIVVDSARRIVDTTRRFQILYTDLTEFRFGKQLETKCYITAIVDSFNNEIVAHAVSLKSTMDIVLACLAELFKVLPLGVQTLLHSDQGYHFFNAIFVEKIDNHGYIFRSMSRKGRCNDNALMERINGIIKEEYVARLDLRNITFDAIGVTFGEWVLNFNNCRPNSKCKGLPPVVFANKYSNL